LYLSLGLACFADPLAVGWAWFLVTLLPTIGLIQVGPQAWADRYAYIPYVGLFVAVVWLASDLVRHMSWSLWVPAVAATLVLSAYAWVSQVQIRYWTNSQTLFSHALKLNPRNGMAYGFLGLASAGARQYGLAEQHFRTAIKLMPTVAVFYLNLGQVLEQEGKFDEALVVYRQSWLLGDGSDTFPRIAHILLRNKDVSSAMAEYDAAIHIGPNSSESLAWRGIIEYLKGNYDAAVADLAESARLLPRADTFYALGRALETKGDIAGAKKAYERVLQLDPNYSGGSARLKALAGR
jgi:tetratricopeptide (TPR) repeat protein